jgi:hypothetical protein
MVIDVNQKSIDYMNKYKEMIDEKIQLDTNFKSEIELGM